MFSPLELLKPLRWFAINPGSQFEFYPHLIAFFSFLFAVAIVLFILTKLFKLHPFLKRILKKIPGKLEIFALVGFLLVIFRFENIYYLSMRIWYLMWLVFFVWYLIHISKELFVYPTKRLAYEKHGEGKERDYLPKPKRKR